MILTEKREKKFKDTLAKRQTNITVLLENVHDPHNIGAVMRTCDAIGIHEIFVLFTEERLQQKKLIGSKSASGTKKWVEVNYFEDLDLCIKEIRSRFNQIYATHLDSSSVDLYDLELTESIALVFGNEHDGLSPELLAHCDGNFTIPQFGMVQSLNISVACAVSLYEALRQRKNKGMYDHPFDEKNDFHTSTYSKWYQRQKLRNEH